MSKATRDRAAIYARFSSHNQRDESIDIQLENCRAYCEERGLAVVGEYCDHAQTGRDTNRAAFQRMLRDADRHLFDFVVIYKVTRIMRNRDEMALLRLQLARDRVEILYAGESIAQGSSGVLQLGMLEVLAEWESALMGERIRDGIQKNARDCRANGRPMFGWDIVDGRYVVNEREAAALRECRRIIMSGGSVADAVRSMEGMRGKRGGRITQQVLAKMLVRPQNYGTYMYAGVVVEGGMPAIWTRREQEAMVDAMSAGCKPRRGPEQEWYPLTGRLVHVHADGTAHGMRGVSGTSRHGSRYHYYQCRRCRHTLRKDATEAMVADELRRVLASEAVRERIADMVMDEDAWRDEGPSESDVVAAELAEVERAFSNILDAMEMGVVPPGTRERVDALKERQALLERELREARAVEGMRLDRDRVLHWLEQAGEHDGDALTSMFVSRVEWHDDGTLRVVCLFDDETPRHEGARGSYEGRMVELGRGCANTRIYATSCGFVLVVDSGRATSSYRSVSA